MLEYPDMPRARTTTTEEETAVQKKRTPRKRVVADGEAVAVRAARAPRRRVEPTPDVAVERSDATRRAPTPLQAERKAASRGRRSLLVTLGIVFVLCVAGAGIGLSDHGQIDVVAVVNERNERVNRGEVREGESTMTIPVQSSDVRPNGGLTPADAPTPAPVPETPASSTASSSTPTTGETASDTTSSSPSTPDTPVAEPTATTS